MRDPCNRRKPTPEDLSQPSSTQMLRNITCTREQTFGLFDCLRACSMPLLGSYDTDHSFTNINIMSNYKARRHRYVRPIIATLSMEPRRARKAPHPRLFAGVCSPFCSKSMNWSWVSSERIRGPRIQVAFRECDIMRCKNWRKKGEKVQKRKSFRLLLWTARRAGDVHAVEPVGCGLPAQVEVGSNSGGTILTARYCTSHKNERRA